MRHIGRRGALAVGLLAMALAWPSGVAAAEITSTEGPLTRIIVSPDLNCQVAHEADARFEFFGGDVGAACGTFLAAGGTLYGPAAVSAAGFAGLEPWTPVSQPPASGSGGGGDPLRLVTTVDAGDSGLRIEQTDSYQVGEESYRTDIRITNGGGSEQRAIVYRAGDCYLQDSDIGFGRVDGGAPGCVISQASNARIEQWVPITPGSHYYEAGYSEVWGRISSQQGFPDQCRCDEQIDNGAGLSWEVVIPAGGSVDVSHLTFFSPEGRQPTTTLRDSVPGPLDISLDPIIVASSAAAAAGVVIFVPFPAALFNATLEENYAEVTAGWSRFRRRLRGLTAGIFAMLRRAIAGARSRPAPEGAAPGSAEAAAAATTPQPAPRRGVTLDEAFWRSPVGILAFILLSALFYSLLDPTLGFDADSVATLLGLSLGLAVMLAAYAIPMLVGGRRLGVGVTMSALPATLLIAIGCVVISRVADFQPGYIYGLIVGFAFSRALAKADEGRLEAIAAGTALGLAIIAWVALPIVRGSAAETGPTFFSGVLETAFATVVVAGLEAATFAMLPVRFMPGDAVRSWNQRVWIALLGIASLGFFHILLNPTSGYLADTTRTSLFTVVWLLVAFGGGSVLFWAYFRFRPRQADASPPPSMPSPEPPAAT